MKPFHKQPIDQFLTHLGSAEPSPGGGTAAALCGALGASLLEMVIRINQKRLKKKGVALTRTDKTELENAARLRKRLQLLMQLDADTFKRLSSISKLNKITYSIALKKAATAPQEICTLVADAATEAINQKNKTSTWLMSDLKEAVILFQSSFESAKLNVWINLDELKDKTYSKIVQKKLTSCEKKIITSYHLILGATRG